MSHQGSVASHVYTYLYECDVELKDFNRGYIGSKLLLTGKFKALQGFPSIGLVGTVRAGSRVRNSNVGVVLK